MQPAVRRHVAGAHGVVRFADAVERGVFVGNADTLVVNVAGKGIRGAEQQRRDRKYPAAAAEIEHLFSAVNMLLQCRQAQPRRRVAAGAEGKTRIQDELHAPARLRLLPLGHDQQPLADLHGLVELLPVVFPVGVLHILHAQQQRRIFAVLPFEVRERDAHLCKRAVARLTVLQIERDTALAALFFAKLLVHIVPVLAVVFEEAFKVALLVDDKSVHAAADEQVAHRLNAARLRVNMQLQPLHRSVPTKNRPSVPQPVCAPMTGPMKSERMSVTPKRSRKRSEIYST